MSNESYMESFRTIAFYVGCSLTFLTGLFMLLYKSLRSKRERVGVKTTTSFDGNRRGSVDSPAWLLVGIFLVILGILGFWFGHNALKTINGLRNQIAYEHLANSVEKRIPYENYLHRAQTVLDNATIDPTEFSRITLRRIEIEVSPGNTIWKQPDAVTLIKEFNNAGIASRSYYESLVKPDLK